MLDIFVEKSLWVKTVLAKETFESIADNTMRFKIQYFIKGFGKILLFLKRHDLQKSVNRTVCCYELLFLGSEN